MIYTDSRYANGKFFRAYDANRASYSLTVLRSFPTDQAAFFYYRWKERDRVEALAARLMGDANLWWRIMDYNPEVIDPVNIPVGTLIRIPAND
jgi:hypothetical protein